jgi:general secretion pathway protein G
MSETSGFTLIELILVTVIIAILAGMVTLTFKGAATDARVKAVLGDIKSFETAIEYYALKHNDKYPPTLKELETTGVLRELKPDPWGNPYVYVVPGVYHKTSYDVFSRGPDGQVNTPDDVASWLLPKAE